MTSEREAKLADALRDFLAMLDSPLMAVSVSAHGCADGQWRATIREARDALAMPENAP